MLPVAAGEGRSLDEMWIDAVHSSLPGDVEEVAFKLGRQRFLSEAMEGA